MLYDIPGTNLKAINLESFPPEAWTTHNSSRADSTAIDLVSLVGTLYRAIDIRKSSITKIPWVLKRGDDIVYESFAGDPPPKLQWVDKIPDLIGLTEASLCMTNTAYWFVDRNRAIVKDLRWFAPVTMEPIWDEDNGLTGYERTINGRKTPYPIEDGTIVYIWRQDPNTETEVWTPLVQAAAASAGVLFNLDVFTSGYFERGAIKATILTVAGDGVMDEGEAKKLKAWWKRALQGVKNAWSTEVLYREIVPIQIGEGIAEIGNIELSEDKRADIATTIGVPPSMMFANAANYATARQDKRNFYDSDMIPDARFIENSFNDQVLKRHGLRIEFKPQTMDMFQADENERSQSYAAYISAGMRPSITAEMLGLDLPVGIEYADLDEPEPVTEVTGSISGVTEVTPDEDSEEKRADVRMLKKWLKRRGSGADIAGFNSEYLSTAEKTAIRAGIFEGDADGDGAPFPVVGWNAYP